MACPACKAEFRVPANPASRAPTSSSMDQRPAPPPTSPILARGHRPKSSPLFWILGGSVALVLVLIMVSVASYMFVVRPAVRKAEGMRNEARQLPPRPKAQPRPAPTAVRPEAAEVRTDPKVVEIPDAPLSGTIEGQPFTPTAAALENGVLRLTEGSRFIADQQVLIFLFLRPGESVEDTIRLVPDPSRTTPHVHLRWKGGDGASTAVRSRGYAMRLEFGKTSDGKVPARLYLELPEPDQTRMAGNFEVELRGR